MTPALATYMFDLLGNIEEGSLLLISDNPKFHDKTLRKTHPTLHRAHVFPNVRDIPQSANRWGATGQDTCELERRRRWDNIAHRSYKNNILDHDPSEALGRMTRDSAPSPAYRNRGYDRVPFPAFHGGNINGYPSPVHHCGPAPRSPRSPRRLHDHTDSFRIIMKQIYLNETNICHVTAAGIEKSFEVASWDREKDSDDSPKKLSRSQQDRTDKNLNRSPFRRSSLPLNGKGLNFELPLYPHLADVLQDTSGTRIKNKGRKDKLNSARMMTRNDKKQYPILLSYSDRGIGIKSLDNPSEIVEEEAKCNERPFSPKSELEEGNYHNMVPSRKESPASVICRKRHLNRSEACKDLQPWKATQERGISYR